MIPELIERCRSGIVRIGFFKNAEEVASGTGFLVGDYLITNHHVFCGPPETEVELRVFETKNSLQIKSLKLDYENFKSKLISGSDEDNNDYAILSFEELKQNNLYQFEFGNPEEIKVGEDIIFLGYHFGSNNLACHRGIISSKYSQNNVDKFQLDASVNPSNSGGPLIYPKTGEVIGIITRRETGFSKKFKRLTNDLGENIERLNQMPQVKAYVTGINPLEALKMIQIQLLTLQMEIERSANVGIGYAYSIKNIKEENVFCKNS